MAENIKSFEEAEGDVFGDILFEGRKKKQLKEWKCVYCMTM